MKQKYVEEPTKDIQDVDNGSTRFYVGTPVFNVFRKFKHRGEVKGYDLVNKLYHIVYDDDEPKEYYYNVVQDKRKQTWLKRRQWQKPNLAKIHYLHLIYAPKVSNYVEYSIALTVENIRSIASLCYYLDISMEDVSIEMIKLLFILYNLTPSLLKKHLLVTSPNKSSRSYQHGMIGRKENTRN